MILLIDTNVFIDIFLKREPFFDASYRALRRAIEQGADCRVSASAATDLFYILRKNLQSKEKAKQYLFSVKQLAHFADVQENDINAALSGDMPDFEDAVVASVASRIGATYILTRNVKDFSGSNVPAISPADWLEK